MKCKYLVSKRCSYASPASYVCMNGGGSYCGKWREFDAALQLKKAKAGRRARQAMKFFVGTQMAFALFVAAVLVVTMTWTENVYLQMLYVILSAAIVYVFFYWFGEWTK